MDMIRVALHTCKHLKNGLFVNGFDNVYQSTHPFSFFIVRASAEEKQGIIFNTLFSQKTT